MDLEKHGPTLPSAPFRAPMRCVCGWCGTEIRAGGEPETTGICPRCADAVGSEWARRESKHRVDGMLQTICSQFVELPGLRLTAQQAQRVWGLDEWTCRRLLETLVEQRFLFQNEHGTYAQVMDREGRLKKARFA